MYELASNKAKISSQLLYGEKFEVVQKKKNFIKIKTDFDKYVGFIKIEKFNKTLKKLIRLIF